MSRGALLLQSRAGWQLVGLGDEAETRHWPAEIDADDLADQVAARLKQHRLPPRIVLAVSAVKTLACQVDMDPTDARHRRSVLYEAETVLPWTAEEAVADFVTQDNHVLLVACHLDECLPWVVALESRHVAVVSVAPAAMLYLQQLNQQPWWSDATRVVFRDDDGWQQVQLESGTPTQWSYHGARSAGLFLDLQLRQARGEQEHMVVAVNEPGWHDAAPDNLAKQHLVDAEAPELAAALQQAASGILGGQFVPWFELRRQELAVGAPHRAVQGALRWLTMAGVALAVSWIAVFATLAWQNRASSNAHYQAQTRVFRAVFPGTPPPAAVLSRMRSEQSRRLAARQAPRDLDLPIPALNVLLDFARGLPQDPRFRVREFRIENGNLDLDGDVLTYPAANDVADALRANRFQVGAPTTNQNQDQSVATRIFAQWNPQSSTDQP